MKEKVKRVVSEFNTELKLIGFRAFQIEQDGSDTRVYSRKEFYKICLTTGKSKIHYSDKSFEQEGTVLFSEIRIFRIPGKRFQRLTKVLPFFFLRNFSRILNVPKAYNSLLSLKSAELPFLKLPKSRGFFSILFSRR